MAATALNPTLAEDLGQYSPFCYGVVAMASGTATVQLASKFKRVYGAVGSVVNAATGVGETVIFRFSGDGNVTMVIETISEAGATTGTSLVGYIVFGIPRA